MTFLKNIFFYSLVITFSIISIDSIIQYLFGYNLLGFKSGADPTPYITSLFHDEKTWQLPCETVTFIFIIILFS